MSFNTVEEARFGCNCMTNGIIPKPGSVGCGEMGLEFVGSDGGRAVRLAWDEVTLVSVEIFRGQVRALNIHTDDGQVTTLIPEDGENLIRAMGAHLPRAFFESKI